MALAISGLSLEFLKDELHSLGLPIEVHLDPAFGSSTVNHRLSIRHAILADVPGATSQVLDLSTRPTTSDSSISISHCPSLGGFAWTRAPSHQVGFDIEENQRLTRDLVARISTRDELEQCGEDWANLWVAKEATWKALAPQPSRVVTSLHIHSWSQKGLCSSDETTKTLARKHIFKASLAAGAQPLEGVGIVFFWGSWRASFFLRGPLLSPPPADRSGSEAAKEPYESR